MDDDDYEISMNPVEDQDLDNVKMIVNLTGCDRGLVLSTYLRLKGDVILTIDALLEKPMVSGDKYIPQKPSLETGLSDEQKQRCLKGRELQDKVNAVFSVAHSKIRSQPALEAEEQQTLASVPAVSEVAVETTE